MRRSTEEILKELTQLWEDEYAAETSYRITERPQYEEGKDGRTSKPRLPGGSDK